MGQLLTSDDLPENFEYPAAFARVVELGLVNLEPWWILEGEVLRNRYHGIRARYPNRNLVAFAARQDRDDVACWDLDRGEISIIHDYSSQGFEQVRNVADFETWLRQAVDDLIEFGT